ncbi:MAG TPA: ABC transporter permease [Acidimicrobiales bacterium]|jgi:peptide/nickel transport system permease protein
MPELADVTAVAATATPRESIEVAPTRKLGVMGWISAGWLILITGSAVLAPILPLADPDKTYRNIVRVGPFTVAGHILGGDGNGRDLLSRVIFGARTSLLIATGAILFGLIVGGVLGLLAGYFKGRVDGVLSTIFNVFLSIPALVMALSLVAVFASTDENVSHTRVVLVLILALGVVTSPVLARITRASTLSWSERDFVKAAVVSGAKPGRIIIREVLPNVLPAMMSIALLGVAVVIVAEGGLALLGVGVKDAPTWGNMINQGRGDLKNNPYIVWVPSIAIFLTVMSLNYLGDVVRARFDVREAVL